MSCYWFNREKLLKNAWDKNITIMEVKKRLLNTMLLTRKLQQDARNKYINLSKKKKDKKRKYQRERYHINTDLNEN